MNPPPFHVPALETMSSLLPAFEFKALISSNDFSAVYMASQRSLDRDVAIKILAPQVSDRTDFRQSFETTARMMAKLNHPNLIGVYDSGLVDGMLYFVMEFVPGKSLERSAKGQCVELSQAIHLVTGICAGLTQAHQHGILHGDLCPANILLNQKAEPKIGNFGFTHAADPADRKSPYGAPEISGQTATKPGDIFAVGAILYELLTGRPQKPGSAPPSSHSKCGPAIDAIWSKATHADPAERYADAKALASALAESTQSARLPITSSVGATPKAKPAASPQNSDKASPKPEAPAQSDSEESPPPPPKVRVGFNWKLVRNLIIIAGLLYAISLAWDNYQKQTAKREREHMQALIDEKAAKEKKRLEDLKRAEDRKRTAVVPGTPTPTIPDVPTPQVETPEDSLARLRKDLYSGSRDEMPFGSVRQGESDYFLVTEPMSWPDAAWFAERHGAHLAIPNAAADLTWLLSKVAPKEIGIWIGVGRSGRREWTMVDGLSWQPKKEPAGLGSFLALDKNGLLRAEGAKRKLPFVIQWRRDGKNPGSIAALLENTAKSLANSTPVYPPGTSVVGNRHYLYVAQPATWREAHDLAKSAGGHLVVASDTAEVSNLSQFTAEIPADDGIWIGAFRKEADWLWVTGEPWKSAKWIKEPAAEPAVSAVILRPGEGWDTRDLESSASGFIIEWSGDRTGESQAPSASAAPSGDNAEFEALKKRARDLIAAADTKRTEQLASNAKTFGWDLDVWLRGLPRSENVTWGPYVTLLKATVSKNRVPSSVPLTSGIKLSPGMAKIAQSCAAKQDRVDAEFIVEVDRVRGAYVTKVREFLAKAVQAGQSDRAKSLSEALDSASTTADWVRSFGFDPKPENPSASPVKAPNESENKTAPEASPRGSIIE